MYRWEFRKRYDERFFEIFRKSSNFKVMSKKFRLKYSKTYKKEN